MDSEENKDLEIVMGGDSDLEISEVGDIMNDLKPNTSKEKKTIIIPVSMIKSQNSDKKEDEDSEDEDLEELEDSELEDENSEGNENNKENETNKE